MAGRKKPTGPLVGKEALTIVKLATGSHAYVYAGQPVPSDVADEELQRLYDEGFITDAPKVEAEAAATPTPTASRSRGKGGSKTATAKAPETPETPETPPPATPSASEGAGSADAPQAPEGETPPAAE